MCDQKEPIVKETTKQQIKDVLRLAIVAGIAAAIAALMGLPSWR